MKRTKKAKRKEFSAEIIKAQIFDALRGVFDPEIGLNVVELGLIREIEIDKEGCRIEMILTTPFCPYAATLLGEVQNTAEITSRLPTTVEMGMQVWDPSMMEEGIDDDWGLF